MRTVSLILMPVSHASLLFLFVYASDHWRTITTVVKIHKHTSGATALYGFHSSVNLVAFQD